MTDTEKLLKEIDYLKNHRVEIGVLAIDKDLKGDDGKTTILEYAIYNEYGTSNIPPRPFMRHTLNTNKTLISGLMRNITRQVIRGEKTAKEALMEFGETIRGLIIQNIVMAYTWATPNKASTLKSKTRKGKILNTKPLLDEKFLYKSIRYQIVNTASGKIEYLSNFKEVRNG